MSTSAKLIRRLAHKGYVLFWEWLESRRMLAAHIVGDQTAYATIQAAVDAAPAGGTITVDAGNYGEQVFVSKALTIKGAQAGVDARSLPRVYNQTSESIVTGTTNALGAKTSAFYIASDNVTIDGFVMQGQTSQGDVGAGVVIAPQRSGTQFFNNIVQNNVSGLFVANASAANPAIIQHNLFRNNNNAGENGGRGIYSNGGIAGGNLTGVVIDGNAFLNNRGSTGTTRLEAAIGFESMSTNAQSNITITNNTFDSNGKAVLFFNTTNILIDNNYVTDTLDQYSGTLRFEGNNQNVTITHNTLYSNTGPAVAVDSKGVPGDNSGFVVNFNNIYGSSLAYGSKIGVVFDNTTYIGQPDVRFNYWGSSSGPGGDGPGTGDKVYGIGHVVAGNQWSVTPGGTELFSPWATSLVGSGLMPYFGAAPTDGMTIQAEDFDHGGEGVAYHDVDAGNLGGKTYRKWQGVDLETTTDTGGGLDIGYVKAGEWLKYSVFLPLGGVFTFSARVAYGSPGGNFHVEVDGVNVTGAMTIPNTGGTQNWTTVSKQGVSLAAGAHVVRLVMDTAPSGSVGNFNWFKLTNTTPPVIPPAIPGGLVATPVTFNRVDLSWTDVAEESGYKIERSLDGITYTPLGTTLADVTTYSDLTASATTHYSYRVRATNISGDSDASVAAEATTPAAPAPPSVPGNFNALAISAFRVDLTWSDGSGETGYKIERSTDGINFSPLTTVAADQVSYSDLSVAPATKYYYRVRATNDAGDSDPSIVAAATTPMVAPAAPSGATALAGPALIINLGWTDNASNENGFIIERSSDGTHFTQIGSVFANVTTYADTSILQGQQYFYRVTAFNDVGPSATPSNVASATSPTAPAAPSGLAAVAGAATQITLNWTDNSSNEAGFVIERSSDNVNFETLTTVNANVTSYLDTGLTGGQSYYYRVTATNAVGPSNASNVASAIAAAAGMGPSVSVDIGSTGALGSMTMSGGTYTVKGAGADIYGTSDAFQFAYMQITGNATIIARVASLTNTDAGSKAGIMFRESLAANAREASATITPLNGIKFLTRSSTGGQTTSVSTATTLKAPYWLKLVRSGNTFTSYRSTDGVTWTLIGSQTITMGSTIYVGLAVSSHKAGTLATATFDNVSVS